MWLEYHFKDIMCEVDYDYEVSISKEDIIDYLAHYNSNMSNVDFRIGFCSAIRNAIIEDLINFDELEEKEDFIDFMKERYQEEAHEKCVDENA